MSESASGQSGLVDLEACPICGALVGNQEVHAAWHHRLTTEAISKAGSPSVNARNARRTMSFSSRPHPSEWDLPGQDGTFRQEVVGASLHAEAFAPVLKDVTVDSNGIEIIEKATLVPEPRSKYDRLAVAVVIRGQVVGHLPGEVAAHYQPALLAATKAGRIPQVAALVWARADERTPGKVWRSVCLDLAPLEVITAT